MHRLVVLALACLVFEASASESSLCSIHPPTGTPESALPGLTKVTQADAQKTALAGFVDSAGAATIAESELEVEHGCLIYSFDVRVAGQKGVEEVNVDAGTGKVLLRKHETSGQETAEAKEDAAAAAAAKSKAPASPAN
jgi:hypothetical protein